MTITGKPEKVGRKTKLSVPDLLKGLSGLEQRRHLASRAVDDAVAVLRSPDSEGYCLASWQDVASALGITKQAAQQRYSRKGL
jgi:hypothetical protein